MTLNERLMAIRCELEASTDPHELSLTREADAALLASGILDRALKAGDSAPEFTLNDASGTPVALSKELRAGPVVVCFCRGEWCPFCALQLTALNETYPDIRGLGAQLLAISPQARSSHRSGHFKPELAFPRLEDVGSAVAKAFGIAFPLAPELRPLYRKRGYPAPANSPGSAWLLPVPATYVIDRAGRIVFSHADIAYSNRLEPSSIRTVLRSLCHLTESS